MAFSFCVVLAKITLANFVRLMGRIRASLINTGIAGLITSNNEVYFKHRRAESAAKERVPFSATKQLHQIRWRRIVILPFPKAFSLLHNAGVGSEWVPMLCLRGDMRSNLGASSPPLTPSAFSMSCADSEWRKSTIFDHGDAGTTDERILLSQGPWSVPSASLYRSPLAVALARRLVQRQTPRRCAILIRSVNRR